MIGLLLVWIWTSTALANAPDAHPLDSETFIFCNGDGAYEEDIEVWCPILDHAPSDRCPGMRKLCDELQDREPVPYQGGCVGEGGSGTQGPQKGDPGGPGDAAGTETPENISCTSDLDLGFLGVVVQLLKWLVAFLVAAGVMAFLLLILRLILRRRKAPDRTMVEAPTPQPVVLEDPEDVPELPSDDLLSHARAAFDREAYDQAVLYARAAALRRLGETEHISIHRSKTDRQYLRTVRRKQPAFFEALRSLLKTVELCRWAGLRASREMAAQSLAHAEGVLQGLLVLACLGGLFFSQASEAAEPPHEAFGSAAFQSLFEQAGYDARWRLRPLRDLDDSVQYLVLDVTQIALTEDDWTTIRAWVAGGGRLLAIGPINEGFGRFGEWSAVTGDVRGKVSHLDWPEPVLPFEFGYGYRFDFKDSAWMPGSDEVRTVYSFEGTWLEVEAPEAEAGELPVLDRLPKNRFRSSVGHLVAYSYYADGLVIGIADPTILTNGALVADRNVALLADAFHRVEDEGFTPPSSNRVLELAILPVSSTPPNPIESLFNARLLPAVLQLLLLMLVGGLWLGWPFLPLKHRGVGNRDTFAEHPKALGQRYAKTGDTHYILVTQADFWLRRLGPVGLARAFRRAGYEGQQIQAAVERFQGIAQGKRREDDPIATLEELWNVTKTPQ